MRSTLIRSLCWMLLLTMGLVRQVGAQPPEPTPVPPLTDEDRRAAFPDLGPHELQGGAVRSYVLLDQLEWQARRRRSGLLLNSRAWVGGDRNRLWFRAQGDGDNADDARGAVHALFGRAISPWWDAVAGIRQDFGAGPARTWAAIGIQGRSPYWFELEATAYIGSGARTRARVEAEYELRLTPRLLLQPRAEVETNGKADPEAGLGAGTTTLELGVRLRYEIRREMAPYLGFTWSRAFLRSDAIGADVEDVGGGRLAAGLRFWF